MYRIKEKGLAPQGNEKIAWVKEHMPVLNEIRKEFEEGNPFRNKVVAICLHLEAKTGYMAEVFQAGGATVYISGSNPLSTDDAVCAALVDTDIHVYSWYGIDVESHRENLNTLLEAEPDIIIDDGGDLTALLHAEKQSITSVKGVCEETTTGITRVKALQKKGLLRFPVIAVNDAYCKHLFDNQYGTGQSALDGIMRTTNLVIAGKNVVVAGYGWVGRGVASRARGMGAHVIVTEIDPVKALEAHMEGFAVMPMAKACRTGDIFVTCTGNVDVIRKEHFNAMKNGAILCNAGHFDVEVDVKSLREMAESKKIRTNIEEYTVNGKRLYVLGEGRLVNLACANGHPAEIMDLSFALQVLSAQYLLDNELENKLIAVPQELDIRVAALALKALNLHIDVLTEKQKLYLTSWEYGT
ncbi:MAG: adenosylhomocysteinase [Theionarchaea archaeon DG-70-1]|nr:MAG: adenosylhomocysteinase [Theionarchaea archaeon DG-70-1]